MEKNKLKNVRLTRSMAKLIGTVVLVDSLIIGVVSLGGHTPIYQDEKKIYESVETVTTEWDQGHDIVVTNSFDEDINEKKNKVVYYKMPYKTKEGIMVRDIETVYSDTFGPKKTIKTVLFDGGLESYVETYQYDRNVDHYITVKENLYDEVLSDACLLMMLGVIDTAMISIGKSYIEREEEEKEKKL